MEEQRLSKEKKAQIEELTGELQARMVDMVNNMLIDKHRTDPHSLDSGDVLTIVMGALAQTGAIILYGQARDEVIRNKEDQDEMNDAFCEMYKGYCEQVIADRLRGEDFGTTDEPWNRK